MSDIDELVQNGCLAADVVVIGFDGTGAERTRAGLRRALECLIGNGMIEVKPRAEWPEWVAIDPPYELPGQAP
jgi:hypothetical protein